MRLIPILTALLVMFALYMAVFQREALMAFARNDATQIFAATEDSAAKEPEGARTAAVAPPAGSTPVASDATAETASTGTPAKTADAKADRKIGVVALRSKAQTVDSSVILEQKER